MPEDGVRLTVKCGKVSATLGALPADDFPEFPTLDGAAGGALPRDELRRLFARTRFACSSEETKPHITGTYLHVREHKGVLWLTAVGLDLKILAMADMQAPAHFEGFPETILAAPFVDEVSRLLGESPEVVELYASPTLSEFRSGSTEITSKVIEPPYVNYAMAIQRAGGDLVVKIDAEQLVASINRALLIADDKYRTVRVGFSADRLTISARSPQAGDELNDEIAIDYAGPDADLSFNASRIKSLFGVIRGEDAICALDAADPKSKGLLITDSADPFCRYVLTQNVG
jgi:DNA polymerase-3 subunit beta